MIQDDPAAERVGRRLKDDAVAVFVVGERTRDVGRHVTARVCLQLERVAGEIVAALSLFRVGHGAAVLDPREGECGGDLLHGRHEVVFPHARDHHEQTLAAVSGASNPVEVANPATAQWHVVPYRTTRTCKATDMGMAHSRFLVLRSSGLTLGEIRLPDSYATQSSKLSLPVAKSDCLCTFEFNT